MVPHSVKTLARGVPARMMALPQSASSGPISHYTYDVLIRRVLQGLPNSQTLKQRQIIPDPNDKANGQDDPRPCRHAIRSIPIARQPLPCVRRGIEDSAFQNSRMWPHFLSFLGFRLGVSSTLHDRALPTMCSVQRSKKPRDIQRDEITSP